MDDPHELALIRVLQNLERVPVWDQGGPEHEEGLRAMRQLAGEFDRSELVSIFQRARERESVSESVGFFLVASTVMRWIDESERPPALEKLAEEQTEIERRHGLSDLESFYVGQGPPEWERVVKQYDEALDAHTYQVMVKCGLESMAQLYRDDPDAFQRQYEAGRRKIHGAPPPIELE
ncbi:MAG: hypothetical protein AAGD14_01900 [Planctomycetota bacterium]